jgi:methionyl-tRNA formyltransferase
MELMPPPVKTLAAARGIPVMQPASFHDADALRALDERAWDTFIVVAYNAILPPEVLALPSRGVLNVHPSLLPALRGPSPIRSAILEDMRETGVTVMRMDEKMDHGPIVAQRRVTIPEHQWPMRGRALDALLAETGAELLVETLPSWFSSEHRETPQDHGAATYTEKFAKADGELDLAADPYQNYLKFCAFDGAPGAYFFGEKNGARVRVKVTDAAFEDGTFRILKVVPEGKKEMAYDAFLRS